MNLESSIKDVISKKLEDGTVEDLISQQLEKGINSALENLFRSYGDMTKIIEEKIKSVMVPYLESYDYSEYIVKLDNVLVEVLKNSATENKKLLNNFKELMSVSDKEKEVKVTELFEKWMKYVAENVSTDHLEVCYDDGVSYESVEVKFELEYNEDHSWSIYNYATLIFECDKDDNMNFAVRLCKWKDSRDDAWSISYDSRSKYDINSLRRLNEFEVMLMKLDQNGTKIILDSDGDLDSIEPEAAPEATFV